MKMPQPPRQRGKLGLLDWLDELYWAWRVSRPRASETCDVSETLGGTQILPHLGRGGVGSLIPAHSFQALSASDDDGPKLEIALESWLMSSMKLDSKVTITGLGEAHAFVADAAVWLQIALSTSDPFYTATIEWGTTTEWWGADEYPHPIRWNDPEAVNKQQTHLFVPIAYAQDLDEDYPQRLVLGDDEDAFQVVQVQRDNLRLCTACYDATGDTALLAFNHSRPIVL